MVQREFDAGEGQQIVVYLADDTGYEIDPVALYGDIAADSATRRNAGQRIVSMAAVPLRHGGVAFGMTGSGFETKVAIAVVYATS